MTGILGLFLGLKLERFVSGFNDRWRPNILCIMLTFGFYNLIFDSCFQIILELYVNYKNNVLHASSLLALPTIMEFLTFWPRVSAVEHAPRMRKVVYWNALESWELILKIPFHSCGSQKNPHWWRSPPDHQAHVLKLSPSPTFA